MSNEDKPKILNEMLMKKNEIESQIKRVEKYIFDTETKYLEATANSGNILKGWDKCFTSKSKYQTSALAGGKRQQRISNNERVFSQTSFNNHCLKDENSLSGQSSLRASNSGVPQNRNSNTQPHRHKKKITQSLSVKKKKNYGQKGDSDLDPDYDA